MPPKPKKKISQPPKKTQPHKPIDLEEVERLAAQGLNKEDICYCLGISPTTLYSRQRIDADVVVAIERGRAKGRQLATDGLKSLMEAKDLAAIKFFLTHRGEDWKKTTVVQNTGKDGGPIQVEDVTPRDRRQVVNDFASVLKQAAAIRDDDDDEESE